MRALVTLLSLIGFLLGIMNMLSGVVGAVWLIAAGQWAVPIATLFAGLVATMVITIAIAPGILILAPGVALAEKHPILATPFLIASSLWTCLVMTVWCVGMFNWVLRMVSGEHLIPALLLAYASASGPWTYMAAKESRADPNSASVFAALFCQIGCIVMMYVAWRAGGFADVATLTKAFGTVMAIFVLLQTFLALGSLFETRRAW